MNTDIIIKDAACRASRPASGRGADARAALIVTGNCVEAIDIAEALRMRTNADHLHLRTVEAALACLEDPERSPICLVFGMRMAERAAVTCLARAAARGVPVLLIVDTPPGSLPFISLQRPFIGKTLDAALDRIGFGKKRRSLAMPNAVSPTCF